jgi:hypothetical protein
MRLLVSMAIEHWCTLKQGNCKNAYCQGILLDNKITIVKQPIGDPDANWLLKQTLYGLRHSPCHWYIKSEVSYSYQILLNRSRILI